jgi:ParB family chromosome partitioning protein
VRNAARAMLQVALSCRDNMTNSGIAARVAGDAVDAKLFLPNMATEDFLACLSKAAIEKAAADEGVKIGARGKDTRANLIERFKDSIYVYPSALFPPTPDEIAEASRHARHWAESVDADDASIGDGEGAGGCRDERPEDDPDTGPRTQPDEGQLPAAAE